MQTKLKLEGTYYLEHWRDGKLLAKHPFDNAITTEGRNHLLDSTFRNQTQIGAWYIGLVDATGWSAFAATDVMASHAGWTEYTAYAESEREAWSMDAASSGSITNSTEAEFNMNATGSVKGGFITSSSVKSGTAGTLWSTAPAASDIAVINGDLLKITYTINTA